MAETAKVAHFLSRVVVSWVQEAAQHNSPDTPSGRSLPVATFVLRILDSSLTELGTNTHYKAMHCVLNSPDTPCWRRPPLATVVLVLDSSLTELRTNTHYKAMHCFIVCVCTQLSE